MRKVNENKTSEENDAFVHGLPFLQKGEAMMQSFACFFLCLILIILSGTRTAYAVISTEDSEYIVTVNVPAYDSNNSEHFLITTSNNGWSQINNSSYRYFYVEPGNYQTQGRITITASGTEGNPRYISLYNGNDTHPGKLSESQQARVLLEFDGVSNWVVDRISCIDRPNDLAVLVSPVSENLVFNRMYMHNFYKAFQIMSGTSNTNFTRDITIQKCRLDFMSFDGIDSDNVAILLHGTDSYGFRRVQDVHVLNCEIINCNDGIMPIKWSSESVPNQVVDYQGLVIDGNHIYVDERVYTNGNGTLTTSGDWALTENALDLKGGSENPNNPMVITNNCFWGYRRTDTNGGGSGSAGSIITVHFGVWNVVIKDNVFFNSTRAIGWGAKREEDYSGENVDISGNAFESIGDFWTITTTPLITYFFEIKDLTLSNNVFAGSSDQARWLNVNGTEYNMTVTDNVVIDNLIMTGSRSGTTDLHDNWFYGNTPQQSGDGTVYSSASDAKMADFTFTTDRYTNNPRNITVPGIVTTSQSPHYDDIAQGPTITSHPSGQTVTVGDSATFTVSATGTAPLSYQWKKDGADISGATATSYTTAATVLGDDSTAYTVVVSNSVDTVTSNTALLRVNPQQPPTITTDPADQTVTVGSVATFSVSATGYEPFTYQWKKDGADISGATTASYTTPVTTLDDDSTAYSVIVSNGLGSDTSAIAILRVDTAQVCHEGFGNGTWNNFDISSQAGIFTAEFDATPNSLSNASGTIGLSNGSGSAYDDYGILIKFTSSTSQIDVRNGDVYHADTVISFTHGNTYQFRIEGDIPNHTYSVYITPPGESEITLASGYAFRTAQSGVTSLDNLGILTDLDGVLDVCDFSIYPAGTPPTIITDPSNQTVYEGETATFSVSVSGSPPLAYQWQKDGGDISGATSSSYTTPATELSHDGSAFTVEVYNNVDTVVSDTAYLTVNSVVPSITTQPSNQTVTEGNTATFTVTAIGSSLSYQWEKDGVDISGATSSSYIIPATVLGDDGTAFTVVVYNSADTITSDTAYLTVTEAPSCYEESGDGSWSNNSVDEQTGNFIAEFDATPYNFTSFSGILALSDSAGSEYSDYVIIIMFDYSSSTIKVRDGSSYDADNVISYSDDSTYQFRIEGDISNHTYSVYVTPPGSSEMTLASNYAFRTEQNSVTSLDNLGIRADSNASLDVCNFSIGPPGTAPTITADPANQTVNEGSTAAFSVVATGTTPLSYQWREDGVDISGATDSSYTTPATVLADDSTFYDVIVSNSAGADTSATALLRVNAVAPIITAEPANQTVNDGDSALFAVTATGSEPLSYQWKKDGVDISGAIGSSYTIASTVLADDSTTYKVVVSNSAGADTSATALLTVNAITPVINVQPADKTVTEGLSATFTVVADGSSPLNYQWKKDGTDISGATSSSYTTPATVVGDDGTLFNVVVWNTADTVTSDTATLYVNDTPTCYEGSSDGNWNNFSIDSQSGNFSSEFDATVDSSETISCIIGFSNGDGADYSDYAILIRFNNSTSNIDVRDGSGYDTDSTVSFDNDSTYEFRVTGDVTNHTYSVFVTPPGSSEVTLASNYAFRTEQNSVTSINRLGILTGTVGSLDVCNFSITCTDTVPTITGNPSDQNVDEGETASFSVTATGTSPLSYQWRKGGVDISGATSSTYITPETVLADDSTTFDVIVSNSAGADTSATALLTVNQSCYEESGDGSWSNNSVDEQTGSFTAEFNATPSNFTSLSGIVALSDNSGSAYSDYAIIIRFNYSTSNIDARNGSSYDADNVISFSEDSTYQFRIEGDISNHTYSVYVTPPGSSEDTLATDYAFRTEQNSVTSLDNLGILTDSNGSLDVCSFIISSTKSSSLIINGDNVEKSTTDILGLTVFPNPFNTTTQILYNVPNSITETAEVQLAVYNIHGELVNMLVQQKQTSGRYIVYWDGTDQKGNLMVGGLYFCRVTTGIYSTTCKMILSK